MSFVIGILKTCAPKLVETTIIVMTVVPIEHFDSIQPMAIGKIIPIPAPARPVPKINYRLFQQKQYPRGSELFLELFEKPDGL